MPATSEKQKKFMDAAAHNPSFAKAAGIPVSVAKEFSGSSKGKTFGTGGPRTRADVQSINKPKTNHGESGLFSKGGNTMASKMNPGMMAMMAKKKPMKMGSGGAMPMKDGKPAFIGDGKGEMKHGGMAKTKKMNMGGMGYANGGSASKRADGVATQGKTKGTMLKKGGMAR